MGREGMKGLPGAIDVERFAEVRLCSFHDPTLLTSPAMCRREHSRLTPCTRPWRMLGALPTFSHPTVDFIS